MIDAKLEELRRSLVDLTRNNRLLNHRSKGQRSLAVHQASVQEIYRRLAVDRSTLQFLAREEAPSDSRDALPHDADAKSMAPSGEVSDPVREDLPLAPAANGKRVSLDSDCLQTLLSGEKLQARLVELAREAHSAIEEQGCNLLYCTFDEIKGDGDGLCKILIRRDLGLCLAHRSIRAEMLKEAEFHLEKRNTLEHFGTFDPLALPAADEDHQGSFEPSSDFGLRTEYHSPQFPPPGRPPRR